MDKNSFKPFRKQHTIKIDADVVSSEGMALVCEWIRNKYSLELPGDFSPNWMLNQKGLSGTFPTRIKVFLKKNHAVKMAEQDISAIGNLARRHTVKAKDFIFDFTDAFDWEDGDFGDGGSCYWGGRRGARTMLADHNSLAIRFFDYPECTCDCHRRCRGCENEHVNCDCGCHRSQTLHYCTNCLRASFHRYCPGCEEYVDIDIETTPILCNDCVSGHKSCKCNCHNASVAEKERPCCGEFHRHSHAIEGSGRAWVVFPTANEWKNEELHRIESDVDACAVYNSYGPPLETTAQVIARYLGGFSYKEVKMFNNKSTEGTLWINNSKCVVVGKSTETDKVGRVSLQWENEDECEHNCVACGDGIEEPQWHDDEPYCESCYGERFRQCHWCENDFDRESLVTVGDEDYCERCMDRHFTQCEDCEEYHSNDDVTEIGWRSVCDSCASDYEKCSECDEQVKSEDTESVGEETVCKTCLAKNFVKCSKCGEWVKDACPQCEKEETHENQLEYA